MPRYYILAAAGFIALSIASIGLAYYVETFAGRDASAPIVRDGN